MRKLFTSESVTEGHPDKLCDNISDSILDSYLAQDKNSRVAAEVLAGKGEITVAGEITSNAVVDIEKIVRDTIKEVGYMDSTKDIAIAHSVKESNVLMILSRTRKKLKETLEREGYTI